jgi:hypothetical protein
MFIRSPIRTVIRLLLGGLLATWGLTATPAAQPDAHHVVLVTLDGARIEEMFGGLNAAAFQSTLRDGQQLANQPLYRRYWADTPEERRQRLMPFFWGTLMREHGSIAGNPARASRVRLVNRHWFSYPGYAEILLGAAHDAVIKSNDPVRQPFTTVLEHVQNQLKLEREHVAVFSSWDVFSSIVEHQAGALRVNAGYARSESPDAAIQRDSDLQFATPTPWNSVRHDAYTVRFALDHLSRHRPRVLYLALGETDDWAHDGRYDRVLEAYARTDGYLSQLWSWLQSQPQYAGRTSLLITTDHGRGRTADDWRHHGEKYPGSGDTWMAFVTPHWSFRGEWDNHPPILAAQAASTLLAWLGLDWRAFNAAAAPPVALPRQ